MLMNSETQANSPKKMLRLFDDDHCHRALGN